MYIHLRAYLMEREITINVSIDSQHPDNRVLKTPVISAHFMLFEYLKASYVQNK